MHTKMTRASMFVAAAVMSSSAAFGQITLINTQFTYIQSEARGSAGRVLAPRVDPVMAKPFTSFADAGSSSSITTGWIENFGTGAIIDILFQQARGESFSEFGSAVANIRFRITAPYTYELSGRYPNATVGHVSLSVSLASSNGTNYRGQKDLYVPGVLVVGNLPNNQTGSITGTLLPGEYVLNLGTLQYAHTTGLQGTTTVGNVTLRLGELPCYADCDTTTGAGVLDLFDFLCFQGSFVSGEAYACDCDTTTGSGVCDVFDFLCFQDAFVGGCP